MVNFYHPLPLLHSSPFTAGACRDVEAGAGERGGPLAMERRPIHLGKWEIRPAMGRLPRILTVIPVTRREVTMSLTQINGLLGGVSSSVESFRRCFYGWNGMILPQMNSLTLKIDINRSCLFKTTLPSPTVGRFVILIWGTASGKFIVNSCCSILINWIYN